MIHEHCVVGEYLLAKIDHITVHKPAHALRCRLSATFYIHAVNKHICRVCIQTNRSRNARESAIQHAKIIYNVYGLVCGRFFVCSLDDCTLYADTQNAVSTSLCKKRYFRT